MLRRRGGAGHVRRTHRHRGARARPGRPRRRRRRRARLGGRPERRPAPRAAAPAQRRAAGRCRVRRGWSAPTGFDARFSALWRRYAYRIADDAARSTRCCAATCCLAAAARPGRHERARRPVSSASTSSRPSARARGRHHDPDPAGAGLVARRDGLAVARSAPTPSATHGACAGRRLVAVGERRRGPSWAAEVLRAARCATPGSPWSARTASRWRRWPTPRTPSWPPGRRDPAGADGEVPMMDDTTSRPTPPCPHASPSTPRCGATTSAWRRLRRLRRAARRRHGGAVPRDRAAAARRVPRPRVRLRRRRAAPSPRRSRRSVVRAVDVNKRAVLLTAENAATRVADRVTASTPAVCPTTRPTTRSGRPADPDRQAGAARAAADLAAAAGAEADARCWWSARTSGRTRCSAGSASRAGPPSGSRAPRASGSWRSGGPEASAERGEQVGGRTRALHDPSHTSTLPHAVRQPLLTERTCQPTLTCMTDPDLATAAADANPRVGLRAVRALRRLLEGARGHPGATGAGPGLVVAGDRGRARGEPPGGAEEDGRR